MSSEHYPAPPPLRRAAVRPPPLITTVFAPQQATPYLHGQLQTTASATTLSVPYSPFAPNSPSTYAPSPVPASPMAMRNAPSVPYNPQQWSRNGLASGQHVPHAATQTPIAPARPHNLTGMEAAMPSPPPPYSPAQSQTPSQSVNSSPHLANRAFPQTHPHALSHVHPPPPPPSSGTPPSARARARPVSAYPSRPASMIMPSSATSMISNQQFPPPPPRNGKERSVSRDKLSSKFSLSSFRNRNNDLSPGPSAIESLQINTSDALQRPPASPGLLADRASSHYTPTAFPERRWSPEHQSPLVAPASRRAASAGILGHGTETRTPIDESPMIPQGGWGPGMALPPPPPGPPPPSSRSHSIGPGVGSSRNLNLLSSPPTRRPGQTTLGPIPPTPQGWQDEPSRTRSKSPMPLRIDTSPEASRYRKPFAPGIENEDVSITSGPSSSSHSSGTLYRAPQREHSTRSIRERRSESRVARERIEPSNNPWAQDLEVASTKPANLDLGTSEGGLNRRGAVTKSTPRSGGGIRSPRSSHLLDDPGSSNSTPRNPTYQRNVSGAAPTPPFSPGTAHQHQKPLVLVSSKTLPTPPLRSYGDPIEAVLTIRSDAANRSTSKPPKSRVEDVSASTPKPLGRDSLARASIKRHQQFIEREMTAETDQERLELFAEFIVNESRLRRDLYSGAFDAMAGDIMDLTRDLWRSYNNTGRRSATPSAQGTPLLLSGRRSQASLAGESPDTRLTDSIPTTAASPASSMGNFTPRTEPASPSSAASQKAREISWGNNYHPSLSPIPSMNVSTVADEEGSRGRSASRWWESDGSSSGVGGGRRLERSKRESKYMGVLPRDSREHLQWDDEDQATPRLGASSRNIQNYGPNEYPPEKVGFHEEESQGQSQQSCGHYSMFSSATLDSHKLDVSRLVTLPPAYPRHHPAVNNSHPDLATIRSSLRTLSDLQDVKTTKAAFRTKFDLQREQESTSLKDRRVELHNNIQDNVRNGVMSFADAAKADADFEGREQRRAQDMVQNVFDSFQKDVANPLHAMFCERITKVTASIEHLRGRLSSEAQELNPNQTQEEGDEKPELLEMLTLLKWLFEMREQLHKEMFELEDERNDLYRDVIVLPYIQAKNDQKVKEAMDFFRRDAQDRKVLFEKEILKRCERFLDVIEQNVTRGVETQLSAFWDIAPGLLAVVQKVPQRLDGCDVLIPPQEYDETPAYREFPLQYLYTLLAHAGRSAYQFIESQTNLLCLLHEVKTGVMVAGSRLLETQRLLEGEDLAGVDQEMKAIRADEEQRLTDDLKEKVGLVESQWGEALGQGLEDCKTMVESYLTGQGGWDDSLRE
ncbi:hypothetical protein P153DRAFT_338381 [Dothidotthia symphoricarpi CBS 119687]|uniref:Uncharacterized protein n=1 Tax=Dothidotthia symphoricarpi CBS 119687 TaxID=1392245 RepID=A0A6A6AEW5_9PLEO|nr:uncharacterized protein P153DRAFT_338381 [Dothidotthia symphoricarpi CBS 119687]KAF2130512.1 hypothetical protein P153DRAFT_338381 [Dothidotthia symphoricarpi CBS 119687]